MSERTNNPERIYLEPPPYSPEGRQWCADDVWPLDGDGPGGVEYVRADLATPEPGGEGDEVTTVARMIADAPMMGDKLALARRIVEYLRPTPAASEDVRGLMTKLEEQVAEIEARPKAMTVLPQWRRVELWVDEAKLLLALLRTPRGEGEAEPDVWCECGDPAAAQCYGCIIAEYQAALRSEAQGEAKAVRESEVGPSEAEMDMARTGMVIQATKTYRERVGCTLHEARAAIDAALRSEAQGEDATDDTRRLEYLESLVRNANSWHDIVLCWDHEDGFWLAMVERGSHNGRALDTKEPSPSLRAAIDAARRALASTPPDTEGQP